MHSMWASMEAALILQTPLPPLKRKERCTFRAAQHIGFSPVKKDDGDALCDLPELAEFFKESIIIHHLILHSLHDMDITVKKLSIIRESTLSCSVGRETELTRHA